jgi:hypothetical protein
MFCSKGNYLGGRVCDKKVACFARRSGFLQTGAALRSKKYQKYSGK